MTKRLMILILLLVPATSMAQTTQTTQPALDPDHSLSRTDLSRRIDVAIRKGVQYLLSRQNRDGSWGNGSNTDPEGGGTALVTLALLSCGESHQSPPLDRAIKFLKRAHPADIRHATYSIGLRAAVYASLPEALRQSELNIDVHWLESHIIKSGDHRGMYDYGMIRGLGGDYSNSQYGVLGVWYAAMSGMEIPQSYWKQVEEGWLNGQHDDGGWGYMPERPNSYSSMTAAAIATLYITNDYLHAKETQAPKTKASDALEKGLAWLGDNFAVDRNVGHGAALGRNNPNAALLALLDENQQINYMLFGYERVGEASGLTKFGTHEWFEEGAEYLLAMQEKQYDGSWTGSNWPEVETAYALLFLSRGRSPLTLQKLQFDGGWNNRSRDAAAFNQFMRRATERHVNWQIATLDDPPAELRESPLLYVTSDSAIKLSDEQKSRLKDYLDQGGLLVCAQDGAGDSFSKSIVKLAAELYPAHQFRDLTEQHPAYSFNFPANFIVDPIRALSNGVRELIVLYPAGDMSWKWQSAGGTFAPKNTPYATLANLWLYATDRANPRFKGEDTWIDANPGVDATRTAIVARLRHDGNWDPEPGGWQRLANIMHNLDQCDVQLAVVPAPLEYQRSATTAATSGPTTRINMGSDWSAADLVHLTDTHSVQLSASTKAALKKYLDGGGLLLMDAAGGSPEAAGSLEPFLRELYPNVIVAPLPLEHPIYRANSFGGQDIDHVTYRRSAENQSVKIPRLRGAMVGKKLVAIVSYEDLSGGLVGYPTAGLNGYSPRSAVDLMRNIILWRSALKH